MPGGGECCRMSDAWEKAAPYPSAVDLPLKGGGEDLIGYWETRRLKERDHGPRDRNAAGVIRRPEPPFSRRYSPASVRAVTTQVAAFSLTPSGPLCAASADRTAGSAAAARRQPEMQRCTGVEHRRNHRPSAQAFG